MTTRWLFGEQLGPHFVDDHHINTMSDHCGSCRFDPKVRVGEDACPFSAGNRAA